jgi:NAD(P)-dependent dehydrogenase (short-subunit alcohol dehydrogenase family)
MVRRMVADKLVAVTGGARGVGLATAGALVAAGARPVLLDVDGDAVAVAAASLPGAPPSYPLDIADPGMFRDLLERVERDHGPLDALVNNAGIMPINRFDEESDATAERVVAVNLLGTIYGTREAFRRMRDRRRGHIINIASMAGKVATPGLGTYSATKFGIVGYTESVRYEARGSGVDFSVILPGVIATRLSAGMTNKGLGKPIEADAVAQAVVNTLARPRPEVYVPPAFRGVAAFSALAPKALLDRMVRWSGGDHAALDAVDSPARAEYEREIAAAATANRKGADKE